MARRENSLHIQPITNCSQCLQSISNLPTARRENTLRNFLQAPPFSRRGQRSHLSFLPEGRRLHFINIRRPNGTEGAEAHQNFFFQREEDSTAKFYSPNGTEGAEAPFSFSSRGKKAPQHQNSTCPMARRGQRLSTNNIFLPEGRRLRPTAQRGRGSSSFFQREEGHPSSNIQSPSPVARN